MLTKIICFLLLCSIHSPGVSAQFTLPEQHASLCYSFSRQETDFPVLLYSITSPEFSLSTGYILGESFLLTEKYQCKMPGSADLCGYFNAFPRSWNPAFANFRQKAGSLQQNRDNTKLVNALARIREGALVRIHYSPANTIEAQYIRNITQRILVKKDKDQRSIPFSNVQFIWVKKTEARKGFITGLIVGTLIAHAVNGGSFFEDENEDMAYLKKDILSVCLSVIVGGVPGAGIGVLIGSGLEKWLQIYSR